eukprot:TRINITY_DN892_c1_g1_i1.p4 TRINITY_DN892_c1_g1~~TRINITY_DN892_c1_g1_i1.p4  ORF type:complete len:100 (-),score=14.71 TRINITY_DN892_c1_g1_i1:1028-1327(-)
MLKVILAFLFVATIYAAYIQVDNSGHFFKISLNGASEVRWTKDNNNYRHLQELARFCPVPGTPVALGGIGNCNVVLWTHSLTSTAHSFPETHSSLLLSR